MKNLLKIYVILLMCMVSAALPAWADDGDLPVPIIDTDPALADPLPAMPTILGESNDFQANEGMFANIHGGAASSSTAALGTTLGYNFHYVGVQINYDMDGFLSQGAPSTSTGAKIFLQYPLGDLTPFISFGMSAKFMSIGSWSSSTLLRSFGGGFNYQLTPNTDLTSSVSFTSPGNGNLFQKGFFTIQAKCGIVYHF